MSKTPTKEQIMAEFSKTSFGMVTTNDYPPAWWGGDMGFGIREMECTTLAKLKKRISDLYD